jgi:hypothetical protein
MLADYTSGWISKNYAITAEPLQVFPGSQMKVLVNPRHTRLVPFDI